MTCLLTLVVCAWLVPDPAAADGSSIGRRAERSAAHESSDESSLPVPIMDRAEVRAGERVTLRWHSLAGMAEELELVFSIDDGRHYDVRVSPELSGGECRYAWRVPNVGVHQARVRLRARIHGRETSGPAGAPFRIVPNPLHSPERWAYRNGEWWEDSSGEPFEFPGLSTPPRGPCLRSDDGAQAVAVTIRVPEPSPPAQTSTLIPAAAPAMRAAAAPSSAMSRTFCPMRE